MPYRQGDYYQGDLKGALGAVGKVVGKVAPAVTKALPGVGAVVGVLSSLPRFGPKKVGPGPVYSQSAPLLSDNCPPGYHLVRKPFARDRCVRHKRMNVTNPKALRRAIRRARGFEKLALKVLGFSRPHKPKGRPYFKKSRR